MDEKVDSTPSAAPKSDKSSDIMPGVPKIVDPRPTDLQLFFMLLPTAIGGLAGKNDIRSTNSTAFVMVRQAVGQCVAMGMARMGFVCNDGSHLAMLPTDYQVPGVQPTISSQQAGGNGVMVAQHSNVPGQGQAGASQPGVGGLVSQYPNRPPPVAHGQTTNFQGDGSKGVMVAQFPNGTTPPPI